MNIHQGYRSFKQKTSLSYTKLTLSQLEFMRRLKKNSMLEKLTKTTINQVYISKNKKLTKSGLINTQLQGKRKIKTIKNKPDI